MAQAPANEVGLGHADLYLPMSCVFSLGWRLLVGALLSACRSPTTGARVDAGDVLAIPRVWAEVRAYEHRNGPLQPDELLYVDARRFADSDTTYLKLSALVSQSQATDLRPCALVARQQHRVLLKTGPCTPDSAMRARIDGYARTHLLDDFRLHYRVEANGDSVITNLPGPYDPEVVYLTLYHNHVVKVVRWSSGDGQGEVLIFPPFFELQATAQHQVPTGHCRAGGV